MIIGGNSLFAILSKMKHDKPTIRGTEGGGERDRENGDVREEVNERHAYGHGSSAYGARWNRDRLLKRGGMVRKREDCGGGR